MNKLKALRWLALAAAILGAVAIFTADPSEFGMGPLSVSGEFGGSFEMTTHQGRAFTDGELKGKPYVMFFGFTHCPEVCPTTLLEMTQAMEKLGADAEKMNFVFVTVDPERDTQELLATYMSNFDKRIIGLRGTPEQTARIAKAYRVYYAKVKTEKDYTINHTATTYLINSRGQLVSTLAYKEDEKTRLEKLKRLTETG